MKRNCKYLGFLSTCFLILAAIMFQGCENVQKVTAEASQDIEKGGYATAMEKILDLSDKTIMKSETLMHMLATAYYNEKNKEILYDVAVTGSDLAITPDGKTLAVVDLDGKKIAFYSLPDLKLQSTLNLNAYPYSVAFSPDGSKMAVAVATALREGEVMIYDMKTKQLINEFEPHTSVVRDVAFVDNNTVFSGSNDQHIAIWDLATNSLVDRERRHSKNVKTVRLSKDGKKIITASNDGTANILTATGPNAGKLETSVEHGTNYVNDAALTPDNKYLITVSGDGDLKIWDASNGKLRNTLPLDDVLCSVDISDDGKYAIVGGTLEVYFIDLDQRRVIGEYPAHKEGIVSIHFYDGNKFIFADTKRLWKDELLTDQDLIDAARDYLK